MIYVGSAKGTKYGMKEEKLYLLFAELNFLLSANENLFDGYFYRK